MFSLRVIREAELRLLIHDRDVGARRGAVHEAELPRTDEAHTDGVRDALHVHDHLRFVLHRLDVEDGLLALSGFQHARIRNKGLRHLLHRHADILRFDLRRQRTDVIRVPDIHRAMSSGTTRTHREQGQSNEKVNACFHL